MNSAIKFLFIPFILLILSGCASKIYELAYVSDREGDLDIFYTDSRGSKIKSLTQNDIIEYNLSWSADGSQIYYTEYTKEGRQIKVLDVSTLQINTILDDTTVRSVSAVSKDNNKLIISTTEDHSKSELYLYNKITKEKVRLTDNEFAESGARFSPDEKSIVMSIQTTLPDSGSHAANSEIFLFDLDRFRLTQLTQLNGYNALPDFSPDGRYIAFHNCDSAQCDIYVMKADGSGLVNITKDKDDNRWPRWSPDGKWIAFSRTIDKNTDIYFISKNGKKQKPVIATEFRDEIAEFKPLNK